MAHRQVNPIRAARELARRTRAAIARGKERAALERLASQPPHLSAEFAALSPTALREHFRNRPPRFFMGFESPSTAALQRTLFPDQTKRVLELAAIPHAAERFEWRRDPLSHRLWPLDYHSDISLQSNDGSDIRALWEINRLNHFITLSRTYIITGDEEYAAKLLAQFDSWLEQNPLGRGPNWNCAMEVALRAMNLLAAFTACRHADSFADEHLFRWLQSFEQHGAHIKRNLEFSYLGTTNHYLTDVVGLLWLGIVLPELAAANEWRDWALQQLLKEMDQQVLPDGADYEGTTGYHRYVLELFLYSFILCRQHQIDLDGKYWHKLTAMLQFVQSYLRPDGLAPLIGDSDGSQALPICSRRADDHAYLLPVGAVATNDASFKVGPLSEEVLWLFGETGVRSYDALPAANLVIGSRAFKEAGVYVLRHDDLYLLFNAARHLREGRSSHRHNDALSIEVSLCGQPFIVDPGTYVYSADLSARHAFRSTAYHSTVQIDDDEQNTIDESRPFLFGNNAKPLVNCWESTAEFDRVTGVHVGYERIPGKVRHERSVTFYKHDRWWLIEDQLTGHGTHKIATRFHLAEDLEAHETKGSVTAVDPESGVSLLIITLDGDHQLEFESQFVSHDYGSRVPSTTVSWTSNLKLPCTLRWVLVPICKGETVEVRRLAVARDLSQLVN